MKTERLILQASQLVVCEIRLFRVGLLWLLVSMGQAGLANDFPGLASPQAPDGLCTLSSDYVFEAMNQMPLGNKPSGMVINERRYPDHRAVEWQLRLEAPATQDSPIYRDLESANFILELPDNSDITLHWSRGSHASPNDFEPRTQTLTLGAEAYRLESIGGRSSDGCMPYFNIANQGGGVVLAIGWTGDWKASFEMVSDRKVRFTAGLKRTHFKLGAGQVVRLPSMVMMSYRGNWIDGQNQFRQLMLKHLTPTHHDAKTRMPVAASIHGMIGFNDTTAASVIEFANRVADSKLPVDTVWLDAGWTTGGFPTGQGNPEADVQRYPNGLQPVGDEIARHGKRFLTWFEPERAMRGTWMVREHPDWILAPSGTPDEYRYMENDGFYLVDFGNPNARTWALETVSKEISQASIQVYRQDFNEYPSYFWHTNEAPDEIGLREIRYINGLYDFLDELLRRHPNLIIDSCASGGRRMDFEMMRRSVCLWRSDSCWDDKTYPRNVQAMQYGLSLWIPLHGLGSVATDNISLRSGMGSCASFAINYRDPNAVESLRSFLLQYMKVRHLFAADFHPLTDWSDDPTQWIACQYHDPVLHEGIVQAFRAAGQPVSPRLSLKGIESDREYRVRNWDEPNKESIMSGRDFIRYGMALPGSEAAQAITLHYKSK